MRIIHSYVTSSFLVTFAMSLVVLTFVMCIGLIFHVGDVLVRGVPWRPVLHIILGAMPALLVLSIPVSLMIASLLVFGRLSADGELSAMRACGISIERVLSGPLLVGMCFVLVCIYLNHELVPRGHYRRRSIKIALGMVNPLELLEEGCFIRDFQGLTIFIGRMDGAELSDVRISDTSEPGLSREIRAKSGTVGQSENGNDLRIDLHHVRIDPFSNETPEALSCDNWPVVIPRILERREYTKREADFTIPEIFQRITNPVAHFKRMDAESRGIQTMILSVELNSRLALSFSCFSFVLLGAPLGMRGHRKETSVGVGISLLLVLNFYVFVILAESLAKRPEVRPDLIVWIPVVLTIVVGTLLIKSRE